MDDAHKEILAAFLEEVEGYLPEMRTCLHSLRENRQNSQAAEDLHRMVHTIKGAAAMVGLNDLSRTGALLEQVMENVIGSALVMDDQLIALIGETVQRIDAFCTLRAVEEEASDSGIYSETTASFQKKLGSPSAENPFDQPAADEEGTDDSIAGILDQLLSDGSEPAAEEDGIFLLNENLEDEKPAQAEYAIDPELLECFSEETAEHLENIDRQLNRLAADVAQEVKMSAPLRESLHSLRRSVHTLKGAAAVIGIEAIAAWGREVEDFLDWLHDEAHLLRPETVAVMREGCDVLAKLAEKPAVPLEAEKKNAAAKFKRIIEGSGTESPAAEELAAGFFDETEAEKLPGDAAADSLFADLPAADEEEHADLFQDAGDELFAASGTQEDAASEAGAEPIDPELLECFSEETAEHLENIDRQLNRLAADVAQEVKMSAPLRESLHSLRRSVHTLKGAAAVIGIGSIAAWGHEFEDFLDWLHDEAHLLRPETVAVMREGCDVLAKLAEKPAALLEAEKKAAAAKFKRIIEGSGTESPAAEELAAGFFDETEAEKLPGDAAADSLFADLPAADEEDHADLFQDAGDELFAASGPQEAAPDAGAEPIDPELLECFSEETAEHLENIDRQLNRLAADVAQEVKMSAPLRESLHSLRRSVHTLKGAAAVIGIGSIAAWGHEFEDFLDWLHDEAKSLRPEAVAAMLEGGDILAKIAENPAVPLEAEKKVAAARFKCIMESGSIEGEPEDFASLFAEEPAEAPGGAETIFDALSSDEEVFSAEDSGDLFQDALFPPSGQQQDAVPEAVAEPIDPELLQCFSEEAAEHLENIDRLLNQLAADVSGTTAISAALRESLHSLRRSVHTLKGAAAVIGIEAIAAWGHEFEDFLDWLHDEAETLGPETVAAMQEGGDLLAKIAENPSRSVAEKKQAVAARFSRIIAGEAAEPKPAAVAGEPAAAAESPAAAPAAEPAQEHGGRRRINTLRVDVNKVDQVVGLSGDMAINLSSFEASMSAMSSTLNEMGMILQRLKNINYSLEAGYDLASIPYLSGAVNAEGGGLTEDFDPLEMDRYSELNILIRSLSEAVVDLDSIMTQSALENVAWQKTVERQARILKDIQNRMIGIRMTPLSILSGRMHRTVREAERTTGHPARLILEGESIMMDTRVWDTMADALMHILRNAVAHGGSPGRMLTVRIKAERRGGQFSLQISDDGKGLDYDAIRSKAMRLYPDEKIGRMNEEKLARLIFRHGFSSTGAVSSIAGRGVGMDVVRDAVEQLNGSTDIISVRGKGLELFIRLPVAVAQLQAVLTRLAGRVYAVPMHDIDSVVRVKPEESAGKEYEFDGEQLPLLQPAAIPGFQTGGSADPPSPAEMAVLIVHAGRSRAALFCEQILGQRDIVFKDLGPHLRHVPCISGVTILGDGSLVPILQAEDLLKKWKEAAEELAEEAEAAAQPVAVRPLHVLVVDDSISVRKVVSNFIVQQGWQPIAARNGIEAVERIREEKPDFVLLDVEMPRMNGFEVLQVLQAQPDLQDIPVAMLTSRSADKYRQKAAQLGARGFVTKPFKADEVIDLIRSLTAQEPARV